MSEPSDPSRRSVSAIATTLNCKEGLRESILGLAAQLDEVFREIVVVDGGSEDGTWEELTALAAEIPALRAVRMPGCNISQGRNRAVSVASGEVILCFDSGCQMEPGYVDLMTNPFFAGIPCDVVGGKTIPVGNSRVGRCEADLQHGTLKDRTNPSSRSIAFTRTIFEAVNGYDETVLAGEDTHFNHKWRSAGARYHHVPEARVYWRVRSSLVALYRMQRRNMTGCVTLHNPWGPSGWATRLNVVSLLIGLVCLVPAALGARLAWLAAAGGFGLWGAYVLFRTMRRGRSRLFANPVRLATAAVVILASDLGIWAGTIRGWSRRWMLRCHRP